MTDLTEIQTHAYRTAFIIWFGLRPAEAQVLTELYAAGGEPRQDNRLAKPIGLREGAICFHVSHLRKALETEAIDSRPGAGYYLTESGMAECRAALWTIGEELRSAA